MDHGVRGVGSCSSAFRPVLLTSNGGPSGVGLYSRICHHIFFFIIVIYIYNIIFQAAMGT
jgi:uncharacterized membrane protein